MRICNFRVVCHCPLLMVHYYIPAMLAAWEYANFPVVCHCPLLRVHCCIPAMLAVWEYDNFPVVCHCPLLTVLYSCDAGSIWGYANFLVIYALRAVSSYGGLHSHISRYVAFHVIWPLHKFIPVMLATSQDMPLFTWYVHCSKLFLWCWPHLKMWAMDEWTIKTPNPICRLFFQLTC